jgi:rod shape-determining protein MreD
MRLDRSRLAAVLGLLVVLHFALRSRLGPNPVAPDLLLLALLLYAIRNRPGSAAVAGFLIGVLGDALVPARFGAGALAHTVVGYLAAWGRAVFFPDNLLVNGAVIAIGVWLRNAIMALASGEPATGLVSELLLWSPLQALTTAACGALVLLLFRDWLDIRLEA